jgi:hypothetical protein
VDTARRGRLIVQAAASGSAPSWPAAALLALAAVVPLLWPGDAPFINDEPQLIANALAANAEGRLAPMGLQGTFGLAYGPLPTWVYQGLVLVDTDLVHVAAVHAALMTATTAAALWWLGRTLALPPAFAAVPLLSPYFWFYARTLWDNTLLLPLAALAYAGYAAFLARGTRGGLRLAVAAMLAMPLVHLMSASLLAPLGLHLLVVHRRALREEAVALAGLVAVSLWLAWPYWRYLASPHPASPPPARVIDGWLFPLLGARLLGSRELAYFYGPEPVSGPLFAATALVSAVAFLLAWAGAGLAATAVVRAWRTGAWSPRAHLAGLSLAALACQAVVHGTSAKFEHPHYQNGTWIATVLLAWLAVDALARRGAAGRLAAAGGTGALVLANAAAVATLAVRLHDRGGTREAYGPTLANQQQVARAMARYAADSPVENRVAMWARFPHTLATLRQLHPSAGAAPRAALRLDYASPDPRSGAIQLRVR